MTLSKSQYIRGLQCPKSFWLCKHRPELLSKKDEAILQSGINVGDFAKRLFPGGYEVEFNPQDFKGMIQKTKPNPVTYRPSVSLKLSLKAEFESVSNSINAYLIY